jgi:hypothetical protein
LLKVLDMKGDAKEISDATCVICCIEGAATFSPAIDTICGRVKSHPDAHNVMPSGDEERRSHRRINATREGNEHPLSTCGFRGGAPTFRESRNNAASRVSERHRVPTERAAITAGPVAEGTAL